MANEPLWVQAAGVDYSAAEDRKLISSVYTPGVIYGLVVTPGVGLSVSVSAGRAVVSDGAGGGYLVYFDTATQVTALAPAAANNLYVTVDPTTGEQAIVRSSTAPTIPYLPIGSAVTSTAAVASVNNAGRAVTASPVQGGPREVYGSKVAKTNSSGAVVVTHGLGVLPKYQDASVSNSAYYAAPGWGSRTATQMTVFVKRLSDASLVIGDEVTIVWIAKS